MPIGLKTAGQRINLLKPEDNPNYFTQSGPPSFI
jgi:hypothetical protein